MEVTQERKSVLEIVFARDKQNKELHLTSDDNVFTEKHRAESHARELGDREVITYTRTDLDKIVVGFKALANAIKVATGKAGGFKSELEAPGDKVKTKVVSLESAKVVKDGDKEPEGGDQSGAEGSGADGGDTGGEGSGADGTKDTEGGNSEDKTGPTPEELEKLKAEKAALRAEYKTVLGKQASNNMTSEQLAQKIAEAKAK